MARSGGIAHWVKRSVARGSPPLSTRSGYGGIAPSWMYLRYNTVTVRGTGRRVTYLVVAHNKWVVENKSAVPIQLVGLGSVEEVDEAAAVRLVEALEFEASVSKRLPVGQGVLRELWCRCFGETLRANKKEISAWVRKAAPRRRMPRKRIAEFVHDAEASHIDGAMAVMDALWDWDMTVEAVATEIHRPVATVNCLLVWLSGHGAPIDHVRSSGEVYWRLRGDRRPTKRARLGWATPR